MVVVIYRVEPLLDKKADRAQQTVLISHFRDRSSMISDGVLVAFIPRREAGVR
jgi:hypothetical protein